MTIPRIHISEELNSCLPGFGVQAISLQINGSGHLDEELFGHLLGQALGANVCQVAETSCNLFCSDAALSGWRVSRYRPSSMALLRRLKGDVSAFPRILPIIDFGNLISVWSGYPVGIYDMAKIDGDVLVDFGKTGELMATLGKGDLDVCKCIVNRDRCGCFGSIVSDSVRTAISASTRSVLIILYNGRHPISDDWFNEFKSVLLDYKIGTEYGHITHQK